MSTLNLLQSIESYQFQCEAGPLDNCAEWLELKAMLQKPEADVAKENLAASRVTGDEVRVLFEGERRHKLYGGWTGSCRRKSHETACGHDHT